MKKLVLIVLVSTFSVVGKSQDSKSNFKVGATIAVPTGALTLVNNLGYGILLDGDLYKINEKMNLYAEASLLFFPGKAGALGSSTTATHIPILGGIRYKSNDFIFGLGVGYGYYNFGEGDKESGFSYSPHIGYSLKKIDILFKYNSTTTSGLNANYIGIGGVYKF